MIFLILDHGTKWRLVIYEFYRSIKLLNIWSVIKEKWDVFIRGIVVLLCAKIKRSSRISNCSRLSRNTSRVLWDWTKKKGIWLEAKMFCGKRCLDMQTLAVKRNTTLDILFLSNHNIHKISYVLCFWASDPLIDRFN